MTKQWQRCYKRIYKAVNRRLLEHEMGLRELPTGELLQLRGLLEAEQPSAYHVMTTLANCFQYLSTSYQGDPADIPKIADFLAQFQAHVAQELLAKEPTIKQGLTLLPESSSA